MVFTGLLPNVTVDLMGVMSLKVPAFSKNTFCSVPINKRFCESNVTKSNILRGVPVTCVLDTRVQPPMRSGKPLRNLILSPSNQPPSLE